MVPLSSNGNAVIAIGALQVSFAGGGGGGAATPGRPCSASASASPGPNHLDVPPEFRIPLPNASRSLLAGTLITPRPRHSEKQERMRASCPRGLGNRPSGDGGSAPHG